MEGSHVSDVEIAWVPKPTPLGISETECLYDAMVGQGPFLCCRDTGVCEVVTWETKHKKDIFNQLRRQILQKRSH